jgi:diguanylate cyclase (GGDEF)-like protein
VLPGADTLVAFARIEFIRSLFEKRILEFEGKEMSSTVSAGVAGFPENGQTYEDLLDAADQGMYLAKKNGGNQVMPITPA